MIECAIMSHRDVQRFRLTGNNRQAMTKRQENSLYLESSPASSWLSHRKDIATHQARERWQGGRADSIYVKVSETCVIQKLDVVTYSSI